MSLDHMPVNPAYGTGVYRRRLAFRGAPGVTLATLDDTHHAMWLLIEHNGERITGVRSAFERHPATPCNDAHGGLMLLEGLSLDASSRAIGERLPPRFNCTHLGDLVRWSIGLIRQHETSFHTVYDIDVPDQAGASRWIKITRDGAAVHRWLVHNDKIVEPIALAGRPLLRGFMAWALDTFEIGERDSAIMLQRGVFVARARPFIVDRAPAMPLRRAHDMEGMCISYSGAHWSSGNSMIGYVRDFTDQLVPQALPLSVADRFPPECQ